MLREIPACIFRHLNECCLILTAFTIRRVTVCTLIKKRDQPQAYTYFQHYCLTVLGISAGFANITQKSHHTDKHYKLQPPLYTSHLNAKLHLVQQLRGIRKGWVNLNKSGSVGIFSIAKTYDIENANLSHEVKNSTTLLGL